MNGKELNIERYKGINKEQYEGSDYYEGKTESFIGTARLWES